MKFLYHTTSSREADQLEADGFRPDEPLSGLFLQDRPLTQEDIDDMLESSDYGDGPAPKFGCDACFRFTVPDGVDLRQFQDPPEPETAGMYAEPGRFREWVIPTAVLTSWPRERLQIADTSKARS